MVFVELPTHSVHYCIDGTEGRPWLTFCNSLGADLHMWDAQVDALALHFRILRYDSRGHGQSGTPKGAYSIADLGEDILMLWDELGIERSHFCGLSIGGMTGMWLGLNAGVRLNKLAICCSNVKIGTVADWEERIGQAQSEGLESLVDATMARWFSQEFATKQPKAVEKIRNTFLATSLDGYIGCCHAISKADFNGQIGAISVPTLALAAKDDPVCIPSDLRMIADGVNKGLFVEIEGRHICNLETPEAFNAALLKFF